MKLIKKQRCNPNMLKELGYIRLSQTTWKKGNEKVQVINGRIGNITFITKFSQIIKGFKASGVCNIYAKEVSKCLRWFGMNYTQIKMRIHTLIIKDRQTINGYKLSMKRYSQRKYNRIIGRIYKSISRKEKALHYVDDTHFKNYNWYELCKEFGFNKYRRWNNEIIYDGLRIANYPRTRGG